ncbi:MAG TPA: tetratricopeptide repeat protein [Geminicoccus sp.]|uniref:tetratricopeptide repeat protein n=1 Tax=Geminicoccus sp. TaxID=2024832 RepID=UPI002E33CB1D|nr:tetratricopeptide repeat protein [Geminicoccus sp.]HEX2524980.1 tetratricopeptide repeat protein [Geminicoccus sp.]
MWTGTQAIRLNPGDPDVRVLRAGVYTDKGQLDEAIREYETALSFDPINDPAWMDLGIVYYLAGRPQDAAEILKQNLDQRPDRVAAWAVLAAARQAELGSTTQAEEAAAEVLRLNPFFSAEDLAAPYAQPDLRKRLTAGLQRGGGCRNLLGRPDYLP